MDALLLGDLVNEQNAPQQHEAMDAPLQDVLEDVQLQNGLIYDQDWVALKDMRKLSAMEYNKSMGNSLDILLESNALLSEVQDIQLGLEP